MLNRDQTEQLMNLKEQLFALHLYDEIIYSEPKPFSNITPIFHNPYNEGQFENQIQYVNPAQIFQQPYPELQFPVPNSFPWQQMPNNDEPYEAAEKAVIDAERNLRTNAGIESEDIEISLSSNFPTDIKGKTFCLTTKGTMTHSKKEIQQAIEKGEGVFSAKLTKHCDYLICDTDFEGNEKTIAVAKKFNITVETEDFLANFY